MRLSDATTEFMLDHANWTEQSRDWYAYSLRHFVAYCREQSVTDVEGVSRPLIRRYVEHVRARINSRTGKPVSGYTAANYVRAVRTFLRWSVEEELLDERVPRKMPMPKREKAIKTALSPEQFERLVQAAAVSAETPAQAVRDQAMLCLLMDTGMRVGELVSLKLEDVHLSARESWLLLHGKGQKQRIAPVGRRASKLLHKWIHRYREAPPDVQEVFFGKRGTLERYAVNKLLARLVRRAGPQHFQGVKVHPHGLRHSFSKAFIQATGDVVSLSRLLGHEDIETTAAYVQSFTSEDAARGAPSVLDRWARGS